MWGFIQHPAASNTNRLAFHCRTCNTQQHTSPSHQHPCPAFTFVFFVSRAGCAERHSLLRQAGWPPSGRTHSPMCTPPSPSPPSPTLPTPASLDQGPGPVRSAAILSHTAANAIIMQSPTYANQPLGEIFSSCLRKKTPKCGSVVLCSRRPLLCHNAFRALFPM